MLGICLLYLFANRSLRNHFVAVPVDEGLKPTAHRCDNVGESIEHIVDALNSRTSGEFGDDSFILGFGKRIEHTSAQGVRC